MSEYDPWAAVYDGWAADMTDDVPFYLLEVAGLETEALYGSFDRRPFDDESTEFVWIARRPA